MVGSVYRASENIRVGYNHLVFVGLILGTQNYDTMKKQTKCLGASASRSFFLIVVQSR